MDIKLGTNWVAPGEGAGARSLFQRVREAEGFVNEFDRLKAKKHLAKMVDHKTNIQLTGEPLTDYDLARIAACE